MIGISLCLHQHTRAKSRRASVCFTIFEIYRARIIIFQRTPAQNRSLSLATAREVKLHTPAYTSVFHSAFAAPSQRRSGLLTLNIFTKIPMDSRLGWVDGCLTSWLWNTHRVVSIHHLLGEMMKTRPENGWTDDASIIIIILMIMIHQYLLDP